jgi:hypothetical protein
MMVFFYNDVEATSKKITAENNKSEDYELAIDYNFSEEVDNLSRLDTVQDFVTFIRDLAYVQRFTLEGIQQGIYAMCTGHFFGSHITTSPQLDSA